MNAYTLRDLDRENYPRPPRAVREHLQPDETVKLGFVPRVVVQIECEWMWVIMLECTPEGYIGKLDNEPRDVPGLKAGDAVIFGPEHVLSIYQDDRLVH